MTVKDDTALRSYKENCRRIAKFTTLAGRETIAEQASRMKDLEGSHVRWFEYYMSDYAKCKSADFHKEATDLSHKIQTHQ